MALRHAESATKRVQQLAKKKVFLSWGGEDALQLARWLKKEVFDDMPYYETFLSDLIGDEDFANRIHLELSLATAAVGIMTDVALDRPWFLYEIAFLKSRLVTVPLLGFCATPPEGHPLRPIQHRDGFKFSNLQTLVSDLLKDEDCKVRENFLDKLARKAKDWAELTQPMREKFDRTRDLRDATSLAIQGIREYKMHGEAASHPCMKAVACKTLEDLGVAFRGLSNPQQRTYKIDYRQYPEYLMHLQRSLNATTQAIAIVDDTEEFWAHKTGSAILETTSPQSQRIFVFKNFDLFAHYFPYILLHAEKYSVFVISSRDFGRVRHRITRDFSVIQDPLTKDKITAFYDDAAATVQFATDMEIVQRKLSIFTDVLRWSHRVITPHSQAEFEAYQKQLAERVFNNRAETGQHSSVIPLELYDAFEEDHPYYREMHDRMLHEFRSRVPHADTELRILEIGAGTGLFTKRLAQQPFPQMNVTALEPDADAHPLLLRKLQRKASRVQPVIASILTYDPKGLFHFVFSSFSEHHIRPEEKEAYFQTVMAILEPGGYLIVGDEFLPTHDPNDDAAYINALEGYHHYIIEKASASHLFEVAELERLALESGRPTATDRIDYKVSLSWYKNKAAAAGFGLEMEQCITPSELELQSGGIYVLVYRKPVSSFPEH